MERRDAALRRLSTGDEVRAAITAIRGWDVFAPKDPWDPFPTGQRVRLDASLAGLHKEARALDRADADWLVVNALNQMPGALPQSDDKIEDSRVRLRNGLFAAEAAAIRRLQAESTAVGMVIPRVAVWMRDRRMRKYQEARLRDGS